MAKHKLAAHLDSLGISAAEASARIGIAPSAVSRMIKSGKSPNLRTASRIVAASQGAIGYDDLLPTSVRRANKRYEGRLTPGYGNPNDGI